MRSRRRSAGRARLVRVVHNGVTTQEFAAVAPRADATDIVFIGELRALKGVDVLLAMRCAHVGRRSPRLSSVMGLTQRPSAPRPRVLVSKRVSFLAPMPAREAFALGRCLVVPSRAESLPYIVLEAAAAGVPLIATDVGGIREIFGPAAGRLVPPADPAALAGAITAMTRERDRALDDALTLRARVQTLFSADTMTEQVVDAYRQALTAQASLPSH